jgi:hypothetical protein
VSIVIPVLAVMALAAFAVGAAVLATVAARHPERAAIGLVLVVALAAAGVVILGLTLSGIASVEQALADSAMRRHGAVDLDPVRAGVCGVVAMVLLTAAGWLVRIGDWDRVDDPGGLDGSDREAGVHRP